MAGFQYSALAERDFRLLSLSPGKFDEPLKGDLLVRAVDPYVDEASKHEGDIPESADSYEAISYVWGSENKPRSITIGADVPITENLFNCLKRVRLEDRPRLIWVDALCINQADNAEKQAQVMLMHDIYIGARLTLAYLGEEADGSKEAMELIEKYWRVNIPKELNAGARAFLEDSLGEPVADAPTGAEAVLPPAGDEKWLAVSRFWNRAWFKRVWVVQEFILARDVLMICGDKTVNWARLWPATIALEEPESPPWPLIDDKGNEVESAADLMANMAQRLRFFQLGSMRGDAPDHEDDGHGHEHGGGCCGGHGGHDDEEESEDEEEEEDVEAGEDDEGEWESEDEDEDEDPKRSTELLSLLLSFREVEATDPRDLYFALLGLAADGDRPEFRPDYSETFEQTALRFGRTILHEPFSEELLDHAGIAAQHNGNDAKFPSWLPDFRRPWRRMTVADAAESEAAGETDFDFGFDPDAADDELLLKGVKVDTIAQMSGIPRAAHLHSERPSMLIKRDMVTLSGLLAKLPGFDEATYPTGESGLEAVLRALTFFSTEADEDEIPLTTLKLAYRFCTAVEEDDLDAERPEREALRREIMLAGVTADGANEALLAAAQIMIDRVFTARSAMDLVLARGDKYVAMVPDGCVEGDEIWVVKGCNAPFVLRKSEREGQRRIVGAAYVHGIMFGEAVEEGVEFEPVSIH